MDFGSDEISRSKVTESTQCHLDSYGFIAFYLEKTIGSVKIGNASVLTLSHLVQKCLPLLPRTRSNFNKKS